MGLSIAILNKFRGIVFIVVLTAVLLSVCLCFQPFCSLASSGRKFQTAMFIKIFTSRLTIKNEGGNGVDSEKQAFLSMP